MKNSKQRLQFWLGNGLLTAALATLYFLGPISEVLGVGAMALWMVLAGVGIYLLMQDKGPGPDELN